MVELQCAKTTVKVEALLCAFDDDCCPLVQVMAGLSAIITIFVAVQGFPGGLPGTMVIFGSFVAVAATLIAVAGVWAASQDRHLQHFAMGLVTVAFLEAVRAIVDLATAASWCETHCAAASARCPQGVYFCESQIRYGSGLTSLLLCGYHVRSSPCQCSVFACLSLVDSPSSM